MFGLAHLAGRLLTSQLQPDTRLAVPRPGRGFAGGALPGAGAGQRGVQLHQGLAASYVVAHLRPHPGDLAGDLRLDIHLMLRLDGARQMFRRVNLA
jgi:hypothetical protein